MHIYESHMGGLFCKIEMLNYEQQYCETCGDSDSYLGYANNKDEAWEILEGITDRELTPDDEGYEEDYNTGGYDKEYVEEFIDSLKFD